MNNEDKFWLRITIGILVVAAGIVTTLVLMAFSGCTTAEEQVYGRWVYWTSPDPVVGLLDRLIIVEAPDSISEASFPMATVNVVVNDPLPMGVRDSVFVAYGSDVGFWIAAVSYNDKNPTFRSPVSNAICICAPKPIVLEWK